MEHFVERFVRQAGIEELNPVHLRAVTEWATHRLAIRVLERSMLDGDAPEAKRVIGMLDRLRPEDLVQTLDPEDDEDDPDAVAAAVDGYDTDAGPHPAEIAAAEEDRLIAEATSLRLLLPNAAPDPEDGSPSSGSPSLFVSYSHSDKRFADRLCGDLRSRGFSVWQDDRDIRVGDSLAEAIRAGIDRADYVLSVITPHSVDSPWVRRELDVALNAELSGELKGILPILRDIVDVPSLLKGKRYADFRPRRYARGLQSLLQALGHHPDTLPVLAGAIVRAKTIPEIVEYLEGLEWQRQASWRPAPVRVEITGGYLSRLRGDAAALNDSPSVFIPHSPLALNPTFPVLSGHGTQIGFGHMQRPSDGGPQVDLIENEKMIASFPNWKNIIYIAGESQYVRATSLLVASCPAIHYGARCDLETVLSWWSDPIVSSADDALVHATNYFPAVSHARHTEP